MNHNLFWTKQLPSDDRGSTAVEFAIVAPVFLAFVLGIVQVSLTGFVVASLNYAVEKGARCAAVRTSGCPDPSSYYYALGSPTFTPPETKPCGVSITGSISYNLNVLVYQKLLQLSGSACFPDVKSVT